MRVRITVWLIPGSVFGLEGRGSGTEGADAGHDVIGKAFLAEDIHLLRMAP